MTAMDLTHVDLKLHRPTKAEIVRDLLKFTRAAELEWKSAWFVLTRLPAAAAVGTVIAALAYAFVEALMRGETMLTIVYCAALAGSIYFSLDLLLLRPDPEDVDGPDAEDTDRISGVLFGAFTLYASIGIGLAFGAFQTPAWVIAAFCAMLLLITFLLISMTDMGTWLAWLTDPYADKLLNRIFPAKKIVAVAPVEMLTCPRCEGSGTLEIWNKTGSTLHECVETVPCMMCWGNGMASQSEIDAFNHRHHEDEDADVKPA